MEAILKECPIYMIIADNTIHCSSHGLCASSGDDDADDGDDDDDDDDGDSGEDDGGDDDGVKLPFWR